MTTPNTPSNFHEQCGCGYRVGGTSRADVQDRFDEHECFEPVDGPVPTRWYQAVFSPTVMMWVALIAINAFIWLGK